MDINSLKNTAAENLQAETDKKERDAVRMEAILQKLPGLIGKAYGLDTTEQVRFYSRAADLLKNPDRRSYHIPAIPGDTLYIPCGDTLAEFTVHEICMDLDSDGSINIGFGADCSDAPFPSRNRFGMSAVDVILFRKKEQALAFLKQEIPKLPEFM